MTKEKILVNKGGAFEYTYVLEVTPVDDAYKAMDAYAKQEAIGFLKWVIKNDGIGLDDGWNMVLRNNDENNWNGYLESLKQQNNG